MTVYVTRYGGYTWSAAFVDNLSRIFGHKLWLRRRLTNGQPNRFISN